jgi:hypothetical protein
MVGEMQLDQYLATRVVELVVHGWTWPTRIGLEVNPPPASAAVALTVLLDLAGGDGHPSSQVVRADGAHRAHRRPAGSPNVLS